MRSIRIYNKNVPRAKWRTTLKIAPLVTTVTRLLNGGTSDRSIRTKHAAIPGLWLQQRFALRAFVKILTSVRGHDLLLRVPAAWTGQHGFKDDRAHGFEMTFEGKPASVVA